MKVESIMMLALIASIVVALVFTVWQLRIRRAENRRVSQPEASRHVPVPSDRKPAAGARRDQPSRNSSAQPHDDRNAVRRREMVRRQMQMRDIVDPRVLEAMRRVPRHAFVPPHLEARAYDDYPLPIGHGQTISQPYIVALMTQLARPQGDALALDIGTGSGYQAAILAQLCRHVYSIEIIEPLAIAARKRLQQLGYDNITLRCGDGYQGWSEFAPFDVIIVAAAPSHIPQPLIDQLKPGGRLVIPVGTHYQNLRVIAKRADGTTEDHNVVPVSFVPMTGQAERTAAP